jgi:xanthine dehydrogenase YagS FAD-binding subunit
MINFEYVNVTSLDGLPELLQGNRDENVILAGGTDLLDRLKERLIRPKRVINIKNIENLKGVQNGKGLQIGALTTIADIAGDKQIRQKYPALSQAAASIATPQLRNMGTIGGNLSQRPRCWYFRAKEYDCLKKGGSKCYAVEGLNKYHAIFGGGPCHIVHPSDSAPVLMALGASLEVLGPGGKQEIALEDFFVLPNKKLLGETVLDSNQVVLNIMVPEPAAGTRSTYLKFREKQSLDFAISSVAAVLQMQGKRVQKAGIVLGGVAPVPWRSTEAEAELQGKELNETTILNASRAAVAKAEPMRHNSYKVLLTQNLIRRALEHLAMGD